MNIEFNTLGALFSQLGLPSDDDFINRFVDEHKLDKSIRIDQASFWSPNKARFLRDAIEEDAEWAGIVDQLDGRLRG
ncbi:DUF2789 domain-containing protein [Simiduia litorea]|uniref:DUF2789 family protein n=1 Tax=Simiduia litorea TaxID=1435348 RepID=UPI0036F35D78